MTNVEPLHALNLDLNQQQSYVRFYRNLSEKPASTVRIFNHSDFYTVHEEDATLAAQSVFSNNIIKYMGAAPKLSYVVLSRSNFEKFIRELLLVKQYRVEVYVKPTQSKNNDWLLEYKGSPGNLSQFEDILFETHDFVVNCAVMGIKLIKNQMLAVSCINTTEGTFYVSEFTDNEFFTELEALIAQISPKECVIPSGESQDLSTLKSVLERSGVLVVRLKKSEFVADDVEQDLNRLLYFTEGQQRNAMALTETGLKEAMGSLQAVIKYLNLTGDEKNYNQYKITSLDTHRYVRLDTAAINALNLLPKPGSTAQNKCDSVFGVLDSCCTAQGRRLLEQWLKQPLRDINLIDERMEVVETLLGDSETRSVLTTSSLTRVPDLLILSKKLSSRKATLQDCYKVYQTVDSIPALINVLRRADNKCVKAILIEPISELLSDLEKYQSMIEQTLDLDMVDRDEFLIKPTFSDELNECHKQKQSIEEKMQKLLKYASSDLGFESGKTIKLECNDQHGYFFRVTLKEEQTLRQNRQYQIIDAIKGGVRFTNQKLTDLNESYFEIKKEYERSQKELVEQIFDVAAGYADTLRNLNICIAKVDVLVAFANSAASAPTRYVRPKLLPEGSGLLCLKRVRHPCLEKQDDISFIPNDVFFKQDEKVLSIITGPNMGGKSTYMRSIGISVLLAHVGCLVPCEEAEIPLVDCILARVGADDCELKGLSTFMLEMVETCGIVRSATSNSLVIIDELGRGTSTYDGCGIAWSIAEYLAKEVKSFTLFATHFHEITQLAEILPTVQNLHVTAVATDKTITPLYQIRDGVCDKSYGIHCARMVDFPDDVIQFAIDHQEKLEVSQGMRHIKDFEFSLKRKVIDEGDKIIADSLEELKKINVKNLTDDELMSKVKKLKEDLESQDNLFIKGLLGH